MTTVVKMNYTSPGRGDAKARAGSASLKYFTQRPDWEGRNPDREVITREGRFKLEQDGETAHRELSRILAESRGEHLYRVVMSSGDQNMTAYETEQWARNVLEKNGQHEYLMVVHAGDQGHSEHPHVHVLLPAREKFGVEEIREWRRSGDEELAEMHQVIHVVPPLRTAEIEEKAAGKASGRQAEREEDTQTPSRRKSLDVQFER
ncbi:hypothetical protein D3875_03250 [Deinococcus cavernae]|uniref:Uncharacterized protein n=1 Tax=Deinococcus cavernae TaxID=2320857 RepID=A0A418VES2_9DEIO|nr:hypothetical protein [Deinococcus cavernae]RJF74570.1 hypothetical protein D3875_03250 [Deinococcus cavernae]